MTDNLPAQNLGFSPDAVSVLDRENPRSVINLLPEAVAQLVGNIPAKLLLLSEKEARNKFRPNIVMNQLRAAFWVEYNVTQTTQKKSMDMVRVFAGVCTEEYFYRAVVKSQTMMAWLLLPPQTYTAILNEAWDAGMYRMREILELPIHDSKGKLNVQAANLVHRVWLSLDQRKHGGIVNKNMNLNISGKDAKDIAGALETSSMEDIDSRLADLRKKMRDEEKKNPSEVIDVKPLNDE